MGAWIEWANPPRIVSSILTNGTWSTPTILSNSQPSHLGSLAAAVAGSDANVSWVQQIGDRYTLVSKRWQQAWSAMDEVAELSSADAFAYPPRAVMSPSGKALLTWIDDGINASYFDGQEWSDSTRVASHDTTNSHASALSEDRGILAWSRIRDSKPEIYASMLQGGLWNAPQLIGQGSASKTFEPKASIEGSRAIVAWNRESQETESAFATYASVLQDDQWSTAASLSGAAQPSLMQPLVTLSAGVAVSAWGARQQEPSYGCSADGDSWIDSAVVPSTMPPGSDSNVLAMSLSPDATNGLLFFSSYTAEPEPKSQLWMSRWE